MVHFGPLTAEIGSEVCGTSANFDGFRVLAALLHDTLVVGVKLYDVEQRALHIFGRAAITLGIGSHFSLMLIHSLWLLHCLGVMVVPLHEHPLLKVGL